MTEEVKVGKIYEGRVTSIKDFGAFVEILPGNDGLCHISELADGYVGSVTDVCRVGDTMLVKVIAIDDQDRVKLSRKAALAERGEPDPYAGEPPRRRASPGGGDRGPGGPPPRRGPATARRPRRRSRAAAAIAAATAATEVPAPARSNPDRADVAGQASPSPAWACRAVPVRGDDRGCEDPPRLSRDGPRRSDSHRDDPATP